MRRILILAFLVFAGVAGYVNIQAYERAHEVPAALPTPTAPAPALQAPTPPAPVGAATLTAYAWNSRTIRVEDHTGAAWDVIRAVRLWNTGTGLRLQYGRCISGVPCIRVYGRDYGKTTWAGLTEYGTKWWTWRGDTWTMRGVTVVKFNTRYGYTRAIRDQIACHELGHAVGVGEHTRTGSCMYYMASGRWTAPSTSDRGQLVAAYRGVR